MTLLCSLVVTTIIIICNLQMHSNSDFEFLEQEWVWKLSENQYKQKGTIYKLI